MTIASIDLPNGEPGSSPAGAVAVARLPQQSVALVTLIFAGLGPAARLSLAACGSAALLGRLHLLKETMREAMGQPGQAGPTSTYRRLNPPHAVPLPRRSQTAPVSLPTCARDGRLRGTEKQRRFAQLSSTHSIGVHRSEFLTLT